MPTLQFRSVLFALVVLASLVFETKLLAQNSIKATVPDFTGIEVSDGITIQLAKADQNSIEISGEHKDKVRWRVDDDELEIEMDEAWYETLTFKKTGKNTLVVIYYKEINSIEMSSASSLNSNDVLSTPETLSIDVSSAATIDLKVDAKSIDVDGSSGAEIKLYGEAENIKVDLSSGSSYDSRYIKATTVSVDMSSGSQAKVHASSSLVYDISSGSTLDYYGSPESVLGDSGTGSSVNKRD